MQDNIWSNELERMKKLLCLEEQLISVEVIYSMILDNRYADKVFILRKTKELLRVLINHPTVRVLNIPLEEAKERMQNLLYNYEYTQEIMVRHEEHVEGFRQFLMGNEASGEKQYDFREVYMDNNSTTKIRPEVVKLMIDYTKGHYGYGNPSTVTSEGARAANMIQAARIKIARIINGESGEIFFMGSGTEANNLAIKGIAFSHMEDKGHIITTMVEHPSVLESMKYLEKLGFNVTYLKPDKHGYITADSILMAIQTDTILVSVMAANNEIGTLYPLREIGLICKDKNIPFMVDGIQAFGKIPIDIKEMNVTLLTFSGHKINGPKGIGGIYISRGTNITPLLHGGGQEKGIRSGTENVGHILALGLAAELINKEMVEEQKRLRSLKTNLLDGLMDIEPDLVVYGNTDHNLSGLLSVGFKGASSIFLVRELNRIGISVSSGSACRSKNSKPSHVMEAIGADTKEVAVVRFGLGKFSDEEDIRYLLKYFGDVLAISKIFSD